LQILFEKGGVFIHTTVASADEDALVAGKIFIMQRVRYILFDYTSYSFKVFSLSIRDMVSSLSGKAWKN
jgi:hypothetical protein